MIETFRTKNHPFIPQIKDDEQRPLWSVLIPTYNCANYLKETLQSVLQQDPGPEKMEIIVIDDFSTKDNPEQVVNDIGKGRVQFIRQKENVGKSKNYATGLQKSKGKYIHILHGDDTVENGFYKNMENIFLKHPEISAAFCQCNYMNESGKVYRNTGIYQENEGIAINFLQRIATWQLLQPPGIVFKREVYEQIGGYDLRLHYIEDWEFYVRAALNFKFGYTPKILANYRVFANNSSSKSIHRGKRIAAMKKVLLIINEYLPNELKQKIKPEQRQELANNLLLFIPKMRANKDWIGIYRTTLEFGKNNKRFRLWLRWGKFMVQYKKFIKL